MIDTLLLNADYRPIRVVSWQRAVTLLVQDKVRPVAAYPGRQVRSPTTRLPWPAVVALRTYVRHGLRARLNRANLLARDAYRCAYCGWRPLRPDGSVALEELSLDHVVPRSRAVNGLVPSVVDGRPVPVASWENLVAACHACNGRKANRTPEEAGMPLRVVPRRPQPWEVARILSRRVRIPDEWKDYLPPGSAWRDYWTAELEG